MFRPNYHILTKTKPHMFSRTTQKNGFNLTVLTSGSKSAPREMMLENSILPKDPSHIRVSTPPRVITLSEHHFPSASDEPEYDEQENSYFEPKSLDYEENKKHVHNKNNANRRATHNTQEMVINPR